MIHLDVMHKASMKFTARLVRREIRKRHTRARRENHRMSGQEEKRVQTRYAPPAWIESAEPILPERFTSVSNGK